MQLQADAPLSYAVDFKDGSREVYGSGPPAITISVSGKDQLRRLLGGDAYAAAMAFIRGEIAIRGDLVSAVRLLTQRMRSRLWTAARLAPVRLRTYLQSKTRAARDIRFHYDRSNEFYQTFLDSRMVYSSAHFADAAWSLEQGQIAKLDSLCRKLNLRQGDRFLDVGCGWGALMIHAAGRYGVRALGCTLSHNQRELAASRLASEGLADRTEVREMDYRDLRGKFDKISSIGMFEHVGRGRLDRYFRKMRDLLEDGGLFLNSGITRPEPLTEDAETLFLQKEVFPGGELARLSEIMRSAENAGFEVLEMEDHRRDYGRTCKEWADRLQQNARECIELAGERTYRVWLLYLAASAVNFEDGRLNVYEILMTKRKPAGSGLATQGSNRGR